MSVFMLVLHVHGIVYPCSYGQVWKQMEHDHYQNGYAYVYMIITCKYRYYASHNIHDDSFDVMVLFGGGAYSTE